jgi:hypothetical protein
LEHEMTLKFASLGAAAVVLGFLAAPASAAPMSGVNDVTAGVPTSAAQEVARRCYWHRGHRHCRYVGHGYGPGVSIHIGRDRHGRHHRRRNHHHH